MKYGMLFDDPSCKNKNVFPQTKIAQKVTHDSLRSVLLIYPVLLSSLLLLPA